MPTQSEKIMSDCILRDLSTGQLLVHVFLKLSAMRHFRFESVECHVAPSEPYFIAAE